MPDTISVNGVEALVSLEDSDQVTESVTSDGPSATLTFHVPYASRLEFLRGLGGSSSVDGDGVITYSPPLLYPGLGGLTCQAVTKMVGVGRPARDPDGWPTYQLAKITTQFGIPKYSFDAGNVQDMSGRPWTTTRGRVNSEIIIPQGGTFLFTEGTLIGEPVPEGQAGLSIPNIELSMTRHWMPFVPLNAVAEYIGTVNDGPVMMGDYEFADGNLLFAGFNWTETVTFAGDVAYEVEYILLGQRVHSWTSVLDKTGLWNVLNTESDQSGLFPFEYTDFFDALP